MKGRGQTENELMYSVSQRVMCAMSKNKAGKKAVERLVGQFFK